MASPGDHKLPQTHRALRLNSQTSPPTVETIPTPQPIPGSVVIRVLSAGVLSYAGEIYPPTNTRNYQYPLPMTNGSSAVGRIAALASDATQFTPGQLVFFDCFIRARDDPTVAILSGIADGHTAASKALMRDTWRDSTYAEYARVPLENVFALNEARLLGSPTAGGLSYQPEDLNALFQALVPYGGLRDIGLQAGETVIVAPATGPFGGAAVQVALAMGARVIAMGRNEEVLRRLAAHERVDAVRISGDGEADTAALRKLGPVDAYFDISPPQAAGSTHLKSAILALRHGGRVSLMGGLRDDVPIPHSFVMHFDITLKGKWMYNRSDIVSMIKMVETGVFKIGKAAGANIKGRYGLDEWDQATKTAATIREANESVVIVP